MSGFSYGVRPIWETRPESLGALRDALARKLSAGQTAKELSAKFGVTISRNSVIGKATRLGLKINSGWNGGGAKPGAGRPKGKDGGRLLSIAPRGKPKADVFPLPSEPIAIPVSRRVQLLDLTFNSCRWPLGDPRHAEDFAFCGADRVKPLDGSNAYCAAHAAIAFSTRRALRGT
ncbi:MAG: GcrA family cell cycle regulator [Hyphomicrobium sp.]|uniref:GcrA family cell cycle regulator n=1 Tax=Hyphomicrobium sp. TaxID=82 RepID=UPI0035694670